MTHLSIRGYASPEGSYAVNEKLARGRTEALKNYVQNLYHFAPGLIETSWCAEDWEGLRDWVVSHEIENREGILSVIDSDLAPDAKDEALRVRYPAQRAWLLANVYPALRHYKITLNSIAGIGIPVLDKDETLIPGDGDDDDPEDDDNSKYILGACIQVLKWRSVSQTLNFQGTGKK